MAKKRSWTLVIEGAADVRVPGQWAWYRWRDFQRAVLRANVHFRWEFRNLPALRASLLTARCMWTRSTDKLPPFLLVKPLHFDRGFAHLCHCFLCRYSLSFSWFLYSPPPTHSALKGVTIRQRNNVSCSSFWTPAPTEINMSIVQMLEMKCHVLTMVSEVNDNRPLTHADRKWLR